MSLLKKTLKQLLKVKVAALTVVVAVWVGLKLPEAHNLFLRERIGSSVVQIWGERGAGSGFHVTAPSGKDYILTNNHVCLLSDKKNMVKIKKDGKEFNRKVLFRSSFTDLCLVESINLPSVNISDSWEIGESAFIIGHPGMRPLTVSKGELIGTDITRLILGEDLPDNRCFGKNIPVASIDSPMAVFLIMQGIKTICLVEVDSVMFNGISFAGASGSPVVSDMGFLIGVLFAGDPETVTDSRLVPLEDIKKFLRDK